MLLDSRIVEAETAIKGADSNTERRKAKERKEDLMRLKRVEQIYVRVFPLPNYVERLTDLQAAVLPFLPGWVMVLLKLLLATVSATTNQQQPNNPNGFPPGMLSRMIAFSPWVRATVDYLISSGTRTTAHDASIDR